eukprot:365533-Chlamydomonas_euryale.AAC.14
MRAHILTAHAFWGGGEEKAGERSAGVIGWRNRTERHGKACRRHGQIGEGWETPAGGMDRRVRARSVGLCRRHGYAGEKGDLQARRQPSRQPGVQERCHPARIFVTAVSVHARCGCVGRRTPVPASGCRLTGARSGPEAAPQTPASARRRASSTTVGRIRDATHTRTGRAAHRQVSKQAGPYTGMAMNRQRGNVGERREANGEQTGPLTVGLTTGSWQGSKRLTWPRTVGLKTGSWQGNKERAGQQAADRAAHRHACSLR